MKSLKFSNHQVADVVAGKISTTWRLNDDKDLYVGETVQLINSETGCVFGYATIDEINIKYVDNLNESDQVGHEPVNGKDEILEIFRRYYGPKIGPETIVKVVKYRYKETLLEDKVAKNTTELTEVKIFTDGGSRGNPGPSASAFVMLDMDGNVVTKTGKYLGITTNNQAEYQAVSLGLITAHNMGVKIVHVYMDSLLVVNQMNGIYKIKNRDLWPIHEAVRKQCALFKKVAFVHVPREMNKSADAEVNSILDNHENHGIASDLL